MYLDLTSQRCHSGKVVFALMMMMMMMNKL